MCPMHDVDDLLRALDDLDDEHNAGDLDDEDYQTLKGDYTVRLANAIRASEQSTDENKAEAGRTEVDILTDVSESRPTDRRRLPLTILAIAAFAVVAGWLLVRSAGERQLGDVATGSIEESSRQQLLRCWSLATADGEMVEALQCYDDVLARDPENLEALSYRGWLLAPNALSAEDTAEPAQTEELLRSGLSYLDRAVGIDPTYLDARAFRAAIYDRLADGDSACTEVAELLALDPPPFFVNQTLGIIERNSCHLSN